MLFIINTIKEKYEYKNPIDELNRNQAVNNHHFYIPIKIKLLFYVSLIVLFYYHSLYILNIFSSKNIIQEENNNNIVELNLDNKLEDYQYENNIDYSLYSTKIKSIAIYFPNCHLDYYLKLISSSKQENISNKPLKYYEKIKDYENKEIISEDKPILWNDYYEYNFISKQIKLAKTHGIYGFGIYIYWFSGNYFFDKYINQFLENASIDFHYLFIFNNKNIENKYNKNLIIKQYNKLFPERLIIKFKSYFLDERYVKIELKPVICIDDYLRKKEMLKSIILSWRKYAQKYGIGELFIIVSLKNKNYEEIINFKDIFNAGYELLPNYLLNDNLLVNFIDNLTFFSGLIYKDINFTEYYQFPVFRGSTLENEIKIKNHTIFRDYYPEHFYVMNKMLINWTKLYHNEYDNLLFINAWNNYKNGAYLEPNPQFGYGSINSISKALFNLSFINQTYNLSNLQINNLVVVQVHIFYPDLINEIIDCTNNIPVNFDLYITTTTRQNRVDIEKNIKRYSRANNYNIKIVENKGRDIYPLLIQMRKVWHKYKYLCHIHTKKSMHDPNYGYSWRHYLYKNILGSDELISNILTNFENNEKLGFIFPDTFYEAKVHALKLNEPLIDSMNYLLNKLFNGYKIGSVLDFPAGDMFWAKFKAIYQIFIIDFSQDICEEGKPLTILYALERIWLYIVKLNGYYYTRTCDYY